MSDGDPSSEIGGRYQTPNIRPGERGNCVVDVRPDHQRILYRVDPETCQPVDPAAVQRVVGLAIVTKRTGF